MNGIRSLATHLNPAVKHYENRITLKVHNLREEKKTPIDPLQSDGQRKRRRILPGESRPESSAVAGVEKYAHENGSV
jgi:hypothetical protein